MGVQLWLLFGSYVGLFVFRFESVVKRCWDASPDSRPEFDAIRRDIDKFYRGSGAEHEGYYSADAITRPPPPPIKNKRRNV